jgi:MFS family permease
VSPPRLGLRENLPQFSLLVLLNAFVGGMVGLERTVLPLLGEQEFGLTSKTAITSFIVSFGITKAIINLVAARLSDLIGRKPILVTGWVLACRSRSSSSWRRPGGGSISPTCRSAPTGRWRGPCP